MLLALALLAAGCARPPSAEQEIRALFAAAEQAAEARDVGAVLELIADDYADADGRSRADLQRLLRGWFVLHPSVQLVTRVDALELESTEHARATLTVGMLGQRGAAEDLALAADLQTIELALRRDRGRWRVVAADERSGLR